MLDMLLLRLMLDLDRLRTSSATLAPYLSASSLIRKRVEKCGKKKRNESLLGVVVHDRRYAANIKTICLGSQSFSKPVRDVVRAQQARDHHKYVDRYKTKHARVPILQEPALEIQKVLFTPWQRAP